MAKERPPPDPDAVAELKRLADQYVVTSEAKLHKLAQRFDVQHTTADLKEALNRNVGKQILAPLPRERGVSAAEAPGARLQADLADFRNRALDKPGAHHYFLLLSDVFTRQAFAAPLREKTAELTNAKLKTLLKEVPGGGKNATLTTDDGKEFKRIGSVLEPLDIVHREKRARNDIAIVDRAMQTIKIRLGAARANQGGTWSKSLKQVVDGYNATPHSSVHGPPETAAESNVQHFMILQDQARNFQRNNELTKLRKSRVEEAGAFREVIADGGRSFKPRYGPVRKLKEVEKGGLNVIDEKGNKALLKRVLAVSPESAEPQAVFETKVRTKAEVKRAKRPPKPMTKKVPEAASKVFASSSGLSDAEKARVPLVESSGPNKVEPKATKTTGVMAELIANQKAAYQPQRTMAQIQKEAAEKKKLREEDAAKKKKEKEAAREAEKARLAQVKLDSKALDAKIREDEKRRKRLL